jgi:uncharacterized membrane protein
MDVLIKNDVAVLGVLLLILGIIFSTSSSSNKFIKGFYGVVPPIFLCYFIPGILNSFGIISAKDSALPGMAMNYLLPASLVLLTLSLDIPSLRRLGGRAVIVFLAGSVGVMIGAPLTIIVCKFISPEVFSATGDNEVWRGMAAIAGSWIGGGANQVAMQQMFKPSDALFSSMIAVDVVFSNILLAVLLFLATKNNLVNRFLKADTTSIDAIKVRLSSIREQNVKIPTTADLMMIAAVGITCTGLSHVLANQIGPFIGSHYPEIGTKFSLSSTFFWMVLLVSMFGIILSNTPLKKLEHAGASKVGTIFLYIMITTIGMKMDILAVFGQPIFFLMGFIWISFHILFTFIVARIMKAPFFFVAVGSQANIGGPASAPVVAAAFDPALAPVGALLAVMGYAIGTYGGYICAVLMQAVY